MSDNPSDMGYELTLHCSTPGVTGATITIEVADGNNAVSPALRSEGGTFTVQITDKDTEHVVVSASKQGYLSVSKIYSLTGLDLLGEK